MDEASLSDLDNFGSLARCFREIFLLTELQVGFVVFVGRTAILSGERTKSEVRSSLLTEHAERIAQTCIRQLCYRLKNVLPTLCGSSCFARYL